MANLGTAIEHTDRNILPLIVKFKQLSKTWSQFSLSMVGRANLVKMVWMPQLLYVLHNCPIWLTLQLFRTIDSVFMDFVWKRGKPRIKFQILQQPIAKVGIAIPTVYTRV